MWDNDEIQFTRLVAEINAIGLSQEDKQALCDSMDLEPAELEELFVRAEKNWETFKLAATKERNRSRNDH